MLICSSGGGRSVCIGPKLRVWFGSCCTVVDVEMRMGDVGCDTTKILKFPSETDWSLWL